MLAVKEIFLVARNLPILFPFLRLAYPVLTNTHPVLCSLSFSCSSPCNITEPPWMLVSDEFLLIEEQALLWRIIP